MEVNIYWTERDGTKHHRNDLPLEWLSGLVNALLATGAEITGIVDSRKDSPWGGY